MSGGNSVYSPLPQSNSDSNGSSEEELHVPQENRVIKRVSKNSKTDKTFNGQKQNIINYKPLDTDGDIGVTLIKFHSNSDEISIMKTNKNLEIFSTSRKICFVLSLLLCTFTTVAFIWILPCNVKSCLSASQTKNFINWNKTLPLLEIYGPISLVPNSKGKTQSLVFLISSLVNGSEQNVSKGGLVSFKGDDGELSWRISLSKKADDIDCKLIDVDVDGYNDCLVIGSGFLKAIHSLSGSELWDAYNSSRKEKLNQLDFPLVIPDLDGDGVRDLLTSCSLVKSRKENSSFSSQNYLVIISGKTGTIVNNPLQINSCSAVHDLMFENSSVISYTCILDNSTGKESLQTINLINVYNTLRYNKGKELNTHKWETFRRHEEDQNVVRVSGRRFTLENEGHCPEDCIAIISIRDEREGYNNKTTYSNQYKNTFGMSPAVIKSKTTNGFVLKLWKWRPGDKMRKRNNKLKNSVIMDREMFMESDTKFKRVKKAATFHKIKSTGNANSSELNLRVIKETIVRITFNESSFFLNNVTEDEVIQVCRKGRPCEPDVEHQKHSVLVADLDSDGQEELVTFTSKYVHESMKSRESNESWQVQARVRVLSL